MVASNEVTKTFSGRPANHSSASRMMPSDTVWPRSGWATMSANAITAAGINGISISRREARSIRRAANRCDPQTTNAILVSSEGCIDNPPTTNHPRVPLAIRPIPGMSTATSITMVTEKARNAVARMRRTGSLSANQQANSPTAAQSSCRLKMDHGEPSSS